MWVACTDLSDLLRAVVCYFWLIFVGFEVCLLGFTFGFVVLVLLWCFGGLWLCALVFTGCFVL